MENSEDSLNRVIGDGIMFLQSLTEHYGSEKGIEVWNAMGDTMGAEVKGKIFFSMLCGHTGRRVKFKADNAAASNAVAVIKCIRTHTGLGLKESKDIWDSSKIGYGEVEVPTANDARALARELKTFGCRVSNFA
jgi:ribosomal protein L7/L12